MKGKTLVSKEAREYKSVVSKLIRSWNYPRLDGRLSISLWVYPPDKRRRDIDNICKVTLDTLQKSGLFNDDSQIDILYIKREQELDTGKVTVILNEI